LEICHFAAAIGAIPTADFICGGYKIGEFIMSDNDNLPLLYEVRRDALAKAKGMVPDERFFSMIYHMSRLIQDVQKEGLLVLDELAKKIPAEIGFYQDMQLAASYVCDGIASEAITEMLTARYWVKNLQGKDALLYFMMIVSILRIQDGTSCYILESLLLAYLPDSASENYVVYKRQFQPPEPTLKQRLLNSNPIIGNGGIQIIKEMLETRIEQADGVILKKVIKDVPKNNFVISLKGLSIPAKEKLFSVIPDYKAEEYAEEVEYMGPVRQIDIMVALAEMVAVFDRT